MPLTPFHFGPAIAIKAVFPAYFSLSVFILSQVLIDLEPLYFLVTDNPPLHRFFHTYAGAGVIFLILSFFGFREKVINAIPQHLKTSIAIGIGFSIRWIATQRVPSLR